MALQVGVITGVLAPPQSRFYYQSLLDVVEGLVGKENTHFTSIPGFGMGDTQTAANKIANLFLEDNDDPWILIGHSLGGIMASLIAIEHRPRVVAVIPIASPLAGTTWTDPINMPVRAAVELVSWMSGGKLKLRPKLRRLIAPIPVARNLATHSDTSEHILQFLAHQRKGHHTYSIIGLADLLVFPHRSAHPYGELVHNYLIATQVEYDLAQSHLPDNIEHIRDKAGHLSIINNTLVHALIAKIIMQYMSTKAQAS